MINSNRLLELFLSILRINSYYPNEDPIVDLLRPILERTGIQLSIDCHRNVLGHWPGRGSLAATEPILLCAHLDTVRPTPTMEPVVRERVVHTDGSSVLGADDKAAVAAIVEAIVSIHGNDQDHPPVEVLFTVGEDVGHIGSKAFDVSPVRSKMAFIPDADGPVGGIMLAAPWAQTARVVFYGRAAHAGMEPENGACSISMAAHAIANMRLGRIDAETTANVGLISGGEAGNVVPPQTELTFNVRSLERSKYETVRDEIIQSCQTSATSRGGRIEIETHTTLAGFRHGCNDAIVQRAERAMRACGITPWHAVTCGGSDGNELNAKGLLTVVISVGYQDIHTNQESMPINELERLANVCAALIMSV